MTTVHAKSGADALRRMETMAQMSDTDLPLKALRAQVASAIDVVVQAERTKDGKRQVSHISYVKDELQNGEYQVMPRFFRNGRGELVSSKPANKVSVS